MVTPITVQEPRERLGLAAAHGNLGSQDDVSCIFSYLFSPSFAVIPLASSKIVTGKMEIRTPKSCNHTTPLISPSKL